MESAATEPKWAGHPVWLVGFRPFFLLAGLAGVALPLVWVLVLSGAVVGPPSMPIIQWHAHEMFYGFGLAVLGGFLLTATKNWVKVRGHHGRALQFLVLAWLLERLALWWGWAWPRPLFLLASQVFLATLVALLCWTLIRHRATDSYRDNLIFWGVLPMFVLAKGLLLDPGYFAIGRELTLGLFRAIFLVMLERTLTPFMKAGLGLTLPRVAAVDTAIKGLGLVLVPGFLFPPVVKAVLALLLAALVLGRFAFWSPHRALTKLDLGVMYGGGAALAAQLLVDGIGVLAPRSWSFGLPVHLFTFGTMGLIIPAMMIRVSKGHTGRPVVFDFFDKSALWLMMVAFLARVVAPPLFPEDYRTWTWVAAGSWALCFSVVVVRIGPLVLRPRVDGKEH